MAISVRAVERLLSTTFDCQVQVEERHRISPKVCRFALVDDPDNFPRTIIAKKANVARRADFDREQARFDSKTWRFCNDWAGNQFLGELGGDESLAPRLFAAQRNGLLVLEDFPDSHTIRQILDHAPASEARQTLVAYARAIGRMHALSTTRRERFDQIRHALGRPAVKSTGKYDHLFETFHRIAQAFDRTWAHPGADEEIAAVIDARYPHILNSPTLIRIL